MKSKSYTYATCVLSLLSITSAASILSIDSEDNQSPIQRRQAAVADDAVAGDAVAGDAVVLVTNEIKESQAQLERRQIWEQKSHATPTVATRRRRSFGVSNGLLLLSANNVQTQTAATTLTTTVSCSQNASQVTVEDAFDGGTSSNNIIPTFLASPSRAYTASLPGHTLEGYNAAHCACRDVTTTVTETGHYYHTVYVAQTQVTEYVTLAAVKVNAPGPEVYQSHVPYDHPTPGPTENDLCNDQDETLGTTITSVVTTLFTTITSTKAVETGLLLQVLSTSRHPQQLAPEPTTRSSVSLFSATGSSSLAPNSMSIASRPSVTSHYSAETIIQVVNIWDSDGSTHPSPSTWSTTITKSSSALPSTFSTSSRLSISSIPPPRAFASLHDLFPYTTTSITITSPTTSSYSIPRTLSPTTMESKTTTTQESSLTMTVIYPSADFQTTLSSSSSSPLPMTAATTTFTTRTDCEDNDSSAHATSGSRVSHIVISNIAKRRKRHYR
ncbi:hypothetical protein G7054_g9157 [Neopestalotiopsis clavispora]|nr:hypothetical protein G7054_g9157 [Neopestalotiopsis clavispora]